MNTALKKICTVAEMIKFEHTVFALPFALTSAILAANGMPSWRILGWVLLAMVGARSSAMAFNRIADMRIDALNPRTSNRALPKGIVQLGEVWVFTLVSAGLFVVAAWELNRLAFYLSPVALLVILGYSYTKRFTSLSHLVLGLSLGIAPVGAWIGVTGRLDFAPMVLSAAVIFWTAGFDIIYSLQDLEFDSKLGLFSIPRVLGPARGLLVSRLFHLLAVVFLVCFGLILRLHAVYFVGVVVTAAILAYEQSLVKSHDLSRVNMAFFNLNGFVSIGFFLFTLVDMAMRKGSH